MKCSISDRPPSHEFPITSGGARLIGSRATRRTSRGMVAGYCIFISLGITTDYFDGIIARLTETASPKGRLFDHSTDFLFVTGGLGGATLAGDISIALPILIGCAFTQYVLDSFWMHREKELRMNTLGRWNGILYFVPLVLISALAP